MQQKQGNFNTSIIAMKTHLFFILISIALLGNFSAQAQKDWPTDSLDTARNAKFLSDNEKNIILEINKIRHDPARYAQESMTWMASFYNAKKELKIPGRDAFKTEEGIAAFNDCISEMKKAKPADPLYPSRGMTKACRLLIYDQELTGKVGHISSGKANPYERLLNFGKFIGKSDENVFYGDSEAHNVIIMMMINDGMKSRDYRHNILDPDFKLVGIDTGKHKTLGEICVINFASTFTDK